ncbi:MAG: prepilin-type cleavage/methylation domain-containing protein [Candidatus Omnitrophica bacterium]|nr:prepilin-type cleavage/methylation domain-containing protein [Candidatus Omnitrophota bacterium]
MQARTQARTNACINNLRLVQAAKDQYALENNQADTVTPTAANLDNYLKGGTAKVYCPLDSTKAFSASYTVNAVNANPTCQKDGTNHKL